METISKRFLGIVLTSSLEVLDADAQNRIVSDIDLYDREYIDRINTPSIIAVSRYGSTQLVSSGRFANDPYLAKNHFRDPEHRLFVAVVPNAEVEVMSVTKDEAHALLYKHAKLAGFSMIPNFNNVQGFMVSFEELRGSIPEHMRPAFEEKIFNESTGLFEQPHVSRLRAIYDSERDTILERLRMQRKTLQIADKDDPEHKELVTVPITAINFGFNRFDNVDNAASQSTAFFSVSDNSPAFNPEVTFNWHLQDTSRWIYAGAIAINYSRDTETGKETISIGSYSRDAETGKETISIGSHH